jgi:UDP-glucose 4-epimerase
MNILLTGGAGYIGSHTAFVLRQAGYTPVVLDSLSHGHAWAVPYGPRIQGDVGDGEVVRSLCATYRPVALIHFAAFIEVAESVADPDKYVENNFHKAARLFDTALACGLTQVVFSNTAAVYGTPRDEQPLREGHPLRPINPYGESKLAAEQ